MKDRQEYIYIMQAVCIVQSVQSSRIYKPIQSDKNQHLPGGGERRWKGQGFQRGTKVPFVFVDLSYCDGFMGVYTH